MAINFGDFNDILELIQNKDPLGLYSYLEIESYQTAKFEALLEPRMVKYDTILHYLKSTVNVNNSSNTDQKQLRLNLPYR